MILHIKKIICSLLILSFVFLPLQQANAAAWPVMDPLINRAVAFVLDLVKGVLANVAKQASIKAVNNSIVNKIGGSSSGGAMFVTNWKDYLFNKPEMESKKFVNDYLSQVTKGRGSLSSYIPSDSSKFNSILGKNYEGVGPGSFRLGLAGNDPAYAQFIETAHAKGLLDSDSAAGNWINKMVDQAKVKANAKVGNVKMTYFDNPQNIFKEGSFFNLSKYVDTNAINTPSAFIENAKNVKESEVAKKIKAASDKAIAGAGYTGKENEKGMISMPGSSVKDLLSKTMGAPIDSLTSAQGLQGLAQAFVTSMVMKFFDQGVGKISARISKEVQSETGISIQLDANARTSGPSSLFNKQPSN